ncbi:MAG: hypothetical protein GX270_02715 [Clostridiaceae bacterium]|nr:hypothetical protein [Clostridiaceae bacterium]
MKCPPNCHRGVARIQTTWEQGETYIKLLVHVEKKAELLQQIGEDAI